MPTRIPPRLASLLAAASLSVLAPTDAAAIFRAYDVGLLSKSEVNGSRARIHVRDSAIDSIPGLGVAVLAESAVGGAKAEVALHDSVAVLSSGGVRAFGPDASAILGRNTITNNTGIASHTIGSAVTRSSGNNFLHNNASDRLGNNLQAPPI